MTGLGKPLDPPLGDLMLHICGRKHKSLETARRHAKRLGIPEPNFAVRVSLDGHVTQWLSCITFQDDAAMAQSLAAGRILGPMER